MANGYKKILFMGIFLIYVFALITSTMLYSKISSRDFIIPVKKLCKDTQRLKNGDYIEPFVRCDKVRNSKSVGSGLGLAIVKKIVEDHDGTIELFSEENKYSKFIIKLPLKY